MHFTCRTFIGSHSPQSWSQYWENEPDDPVLASEKGHLFGLINLDSADAGSDIASLGRDIIFELNQSYYSSDRAVDPLSCLKDTVNSLYINPLYHNTGLNLLIAVIIKGRIYLAGQGNGRVILNRQDKIATVLTARIEEVTSVSGPILDQDKIMLSTDSFFRAIGWANIKTYLSADKIQTIEENFLSTLYSFTNQDNLAAALIQIHEEEASVLETVTPAKPVIVEPIDAQNTYVQKIDIKPSVFVSNHETHQVNKRKKINLAAALILLICLGASSYFGYRKNNANRTEAQYQQYKIQLDQKINQTLALKNLNINSALDSAKELQEIYGKMAALKVHQGELADYQKNINILLTQTGSPDTFSPDQFYDTSLIVNNPQFSKMVIDKGKLYLLDLSAGRIDTVDAESKSTKNLLINGQLKDIKNIIGNNGDIFVYNSAGLSLVGKTGLTAKITFPDTISATEVQPWNGAFYVLDAAHTAIWKFTPNSTGFGTPANWLKDGEKTEANPVSMAINGKIWTVSSAGQIVPFSQGKKAEFKLNQDLKINNPDNLATTPEGEYLVFTSGGNNVYIIKKDGTVVSKYNLASLKALDLALDDSTVYVLCSDQKIYKINL